MKQSHSIFIISLLTIYGSLFGQDIINDIGSNGKFIVRNPTDSLFVINGSTGNIGIGTINPIFGLDLKGDFRIISAGDNDGQFNFDVIDGDEAYFRMFNGNNFGLIAQSDANSPKLGTYTGSSLYIYPYSDASTLDAAKGALATFDFGDMNVGIGTTNPTAKLEVAGQVKITGGTPGAGKILISDSNGLATWETPSNSSFWTVGTGDNIYRNDGNIGIGTANPGAKLDVYGDIFMYNNLFQFYRTYEDFGNVLNIRTRDDNHFGDFRFEAEKTDVSQVKELLFIDGDNGSIGIGTTTPTEMLTVAGRVESTTGGFKFPDGTIQTTAGGGVAGDNWGIQVVVSDASLNGDGTTGSPLTVVTGGSADGDAWGVTGEDQNSAIGRIGNVGIGTTTPSFPLDIQPSDSGVAILLRESDENNYAINIKSHSDRGEILSYYNNSVHNSIAIDAAFADSLIFADYSEGKVGVGTTTPTQMLDVADTIRTSGGIEFPDGTVQTTAGITGINGFTQTNNNIFLVDGSFGIGTTNVQDYHLAVGGKVIAEEIKVSTGWSDFVFKEGYKLRALYEVEKYINKNGHLPDIPSESEVLDNGINLGEMQSKLLQKIEELTLYVIELKKENEELTEKINKLK